MAIPNGTHPAPPSTLQSDAGLPVERRQALANTLDDLELLALLLDPTADLGHKERAQLSLTLVRLIASVKMHAGGSG